MRARSLVPLVGRPVCRLLAVLLLCAVAGVARGKVDAGEVAVSTAAVPAEAVSATPAPSPGAGSREDLGAFFAIGMAINLLLVVAFLVWARGQWRKTRKR